jgi:hypothetical protein
VLLGVNPTASVISSGVRSALEMTRLAVAHVVLSGLIDEDPLRH